MKYYDKSTKTGTNKESATTVLSTDDSVKEFFKKLPNGFRLEFTTDGLPLIVEIPALTQTELDQRIKNDRVIEIDARLDRIDILSVRSLRSKSKGRGTTDDDTKLTELDDEAILLREERTILKA